VAILTSSALIMQRSNRCTLYSIFRKTYPSSPAVAENEPIVRRCLE